MSEDLANQLIEAGSAETFLRTRSEATDWRIVASLKTEVDRLVACDLNQAERLADRVCALASVIGDPLSGAFADAIRARVLDNLGRYSESDGLYERAAVVMRGARLTREAAIVQKQQITPLVHLGLYGPALQKARGARRVLARTEPLHYAQLEANIGNIYYRLDQYGSALAHYERARDLVASSGDEAMLATIDFSRSNVLADTDRPDDALRLLREAASAFERAGRFLQAGQARFEMAHLEYLRGNYYTALDGYYKARDRLAELGSTTLVAYCNLDLAELLLAMNAFEEASDNASRAQSVFDELEMPFEAARSRLAHGLAAMGLGQFAETGAHFLRARQVFASSGNKVFTAITDSYLAELADRLGDIHETFQRAQVSLRFFIRRNLPVRAAHCRLQLARAAHRTGGSARALRLARSALALVTGLRAPGVVSQCHHLIGRVEREVNRPHEALNAFLRAVEEIENMRAGVGVDEFKATFLRDKVAVYEDAIAACLEDGRHELESKAFALVESSKSRALAEIISRYALGRPSNPHPAAKRGPDHSEPARLQKLIEEMNWYIARTAREQDAGSHPRVASCHRATILKKEREIAALFRRLEGEDLAVAGLEPARPMTMHDLCNSLEKGESAIEYFTMGDQISAFVATRAGVRVVRNAGSLRRVELMLSGLRFQIRKFGYGRDYVLKHQASLERAVDRHLLALRAEVFAPVENLVTEARVTIIPHGALHYVPFHALGGEGAYLIDDLEISYAPSAAVLKLCRTAGKRTARAWRARTARSEAKVGINSGTETHHQMVAVGVSDSETPNISREVEAVSGIFAGSISILDHEATRENVFRAAPSARFLHIATHGHFQRDNPMFSYLNLADCRLSFYNLLELRLSAEMAALSACHTGANAVMPGDELHGLMRGFLYAGVPTTVTSLWSASDESTTDLMKRMYQNIRDGESKRSALRKAQLAIRDSYRHPYYWAPFVLMGCPD